MLTTRTLDAATLQAEGWPAAILALDRENMLPVLRAAGLDFPEARRLEGLRDGTTLVILLLDGDALAGYVELGRDRDDARDVYLGSLQLRARYRHTRALAVLLVEAARALAPLPFGRLRTGVQRNNEPAARLYRKLGFVLTERADNPASWRVEGGRGLLDSELMKRLARAVAGKYQRLAASAAATPS